MSKKKDVPVAQAAAPEARPVAPWTGFGSLRDEIERVFDAFEPPAWFARRGPGGEHARGPMVLSPAVDLAETDDGYALTAELPGLDAGDIDIRVGDGTLTIRGEKSEEKTEERTDYHLSERRWGSVHRTIRLPGDVDRDAISADFAKGVLTVRLPKSAAARAAERKIEVKAA